MNIGIVTTWFERGASYVSQQYIQTLSIKHSMFVYARGGEKFGTGMEWQGSNVTFGDLKWGKDFSSEARKKNLAHFKSWLVDNKIDLVIFNEEHWWEPVMLCNSLHIRTVAYIDYYTKQTVPFFHIYDVLMCHTKRHYGVFSSHQQVVYVPWGTDVDVFVPHPQHSEISFFHSAGMNPHRKGTDLILEALKKIKRTDFKLIIHTQKNIETNDPRVQVVHKTIGPPGLYHMGDVYVYPSRLEGIGLTIAEALACGLPVITPDNAPMNEFVDNDRGQLVAIDSFNVRHDGYYWPECTVSVDDLAQKIEFYIHNKNKIKEHSLRARAYAEEYLSWKKNSQKIVEKIDAAVLLPIIGKEEIYAAIRKYEAIKTSKIRRTIHKIMSLKFGFIIYAFRYMIRYVYE